MTVPAVRVVRCGTWSEFSKRMDRELGEIFAPGGRYIYRGHSNADHKLVSYFDRTFTALSNEQRRRALERLKGLFISTAGVHRAELPTEDDQIWALAQHHGLSTKMLDWSESRYVAAFFACALLRDQYPSALDAEKDSKRLAAVYALDTSSTIWGDEGGVAVVRPTGAAMNERLRRQRGLFTVNHSDERSIEDFVRKYIRRNKEEVDRSPLYRFDLPVSEVRHALRDLHEMRISHAELFPGLDGVAKEAMLREWLV